MMKNSPIEQVFFRGKDFFIKRDELLSTEFSGNKARKFMYFLDHPPSCKHIVSYGSNQSNAMYSLSVLAKRLGVRFSYLTHHLPLVLKQNPTGNYKEALKNGMELVLSENPSEEYLNIGDKNTLHIKEGGAQSFSEYGIKGLAKEINSWAGDKKYDIFLPSGTGTTAVFLQKYTHLKVYTCACVGDENYLKKQFSSLFDGEHPEILSTVKKYHFGKIKKELYEIWSELKQSTKIEFDLLYDPVGWISLFENLSVFKHPIIYIHQGGLLGNVSLYERYKYKGWA